MIVDILNSGEDSLVASDFAATAFVCSAAGALEPTIQRGNGVAGNGSTAAPLSVCLSTDVGNTAVFGSDGCIFVPAGSITVADTNCIGLTLTAANALTADPIISPAIGGIGNLLSCTATGLYVPAAQNTAVCPSAYFTGVPV